MSTKKDFYTIPREEAADNLGVSTRTLDRYLKTGKLKFKSVGRNVFVHALELKKLTELFLKKKSKQEKQSSPGRSQNEKVEPIMTVDNNIEEKIFRNLYTEATSELKLKQEKLEAASFRVGQLEAQLKNSVPLLEYKQKEEELQQENKNLLRQSESAKTKFLVSLVSAIVLGLLTVVFGALLAL